MFDDIYRGGTLHILYQIRYTTQYLLKKMVCCTATYIPTYFVFLPFSPEAFFKELEIQQTRHCYGRWRISEFVTQLAD